MFFLLEGYNLCSSSGGFSPVFFLLAGFSPVWDARCRRSDGVWRRGAAAGLGLPDQSSFCLRHWWRPALPEPGEGHLRQCAENRGQGEDTRLNNRNLNKDLLSIHGRYFIAEVKRTKSLCPLCHGLLRRHSCGAGIPGQELYPWHCGSYKRVIIDLKSR